VRGVVENKRIDFFLIKKHPVVSVWTIRAMEKSVRRDGFARVLFQVVIWPAQMNRRRKYHPKRERFLRPTSRPVTAPSDAGGLAVLEYPKTVRV